MDTCRLPVATPEPWTLSRLVSGPSHTGLRAQALSAPRTPQSPEPRVPPCLTTRAHQWVQVSADGRGPPSPQLPGWACRVQA